MLPPPGSISYATAVARYGTSYEGVVAYYGEARIREMIEVRPCLYLLQALNEQRVGKKIDDAPPDIQEAARNLGLPALASLAGRDDPEFMSQVVVKTKCAWLLKLASARLLDSPEFAKSVIKIDASAYGQFSATVRGNLDVLDTYIASHKEQHKFSKYVSAFGIPDALYFDPNFIEKYKEHVEIRGFNVPLYSDGDSSDDSDD